MNDEITTEFTMNREMADAKRDALEDIQHTLESAGYSAYVSEFRDTSGDDDFCDTFEVTLVMGLSKEQNPDR